jgi:dipeptidyl aminopeptidase/acylaminoacyl peptidase
LKLHGYVTPGHALVASALALVGCCSTSLAQQVPFTVHHSVEWTRILGVAAGRSAQARDAILFSPDRARFLIHTRRGEVARNANVERIVIFDIAAVDDYLAARDAAPPQGRVLAEVLVQQDSNELTSITWIDERRVGFLSEGDNDVLQVFIADVSTGTADQVTSSANGVASFAIAGDVLLFYSYRDTPVALVQPIGDQAISSVIVPPDAASQAVELFEASLSSGVTRRVDLPAARISAEYRTIWLAPSGRYGVVLAPALAAPNHWSAYRAGAEESRYTGEAVVPAPDTMAALLSSKLRYLIVDLERHEARPLLDAPSGSIAQTFGPTGVYWLDGERSVIVSHTYLPLNGVGDPERARRTSGPAIAQVDLRSGTAVPITWEPPAGSLARPEWTGLIRSATWDAGRATLHVQRQDRSGATTHEYFRRAGSRWRQIFGARSSEAKMRLSVDVRQALNERPRLYASSAARSAKVLFDPNPGADALAFGRVEALSWTDDNGLPWRGGLIYPTGYVAGRRYPMVLQTHGFRADRFLLDGPAEDGGTAFAAQALANAGFVVLQASESPAAITNDEREARLVAQGWQAALRKLADRGLIDPDRIGIVAFSRTCMHAIRFLADFPELAAAVTLADGPWWGYSHQSLLTNYPKSMVDEVLRTTGGKPDPHRIQEWFDAQPLYKLPDSRAAIRIEAMGPASLVALWETFAILQDAARPVDMIYFPLGAHNLLKPVERIASQEGNVDWFRFWLKGEEDTNPQKVDQYQRWRRLRERVGRTR